MSSSKAAKATKTKRGKGKKDAPVRTKKVEILQGTLEQVKSIDTNSEAIGNSAGGDGASGSAAATDNDGKPKRFVYRDFSKIPECDFDVDYEIDQEGLLQALEDSTSLAANQTLQHQQQLSAATASSFHLLSSSSPPPPVLRASGWVRSQRFPVKLYALLSQPQLSHVITWMPHGRSWKVLKPRIFETAVLPVFFESDNYHSFNRVINAWSFRRKSGGPDRGSYFHELFLRGKPHLQKYMRRLPRTHKKLAMAKDEEPDFYDLEKTSPLPTLEEASAALEVRKAQRMNEYQQQHEQQQQQHPPTAAEAAAVPSMLPAQQHFHQQEQEVDGVDGTFAAATFLQNMHSSNDNNIDFNVNVSNATIPNPSNISNSMPYPPTLP